jgi:hypothetical protein
MMQQLRSLCSSNINALRRKIKPVDPKIRVFAISILGPMRRIQVFSQGPFVPAMRRSANATSASRLWAMEATASFKVRDNQAELRESIEAELQAALSLCN